MKRDPTEALRSTMRLWASGVTVVTTAHGGRRAGLTASSFTSVSVDPPLVLVCVHKRTDTAKLIRRARAFAISILGENQEAVARRFAGQTPIAPGTDRFTGVRTRARKTGAPTIEGSRAWLDCRLVGVRSLSSHFLVLGEVVATGRSNRPARPLLYHDRGYGRIAKR